MIQIYSPYTSERLKYVLSYIFEHRLGLPYELCDEVGTIGKSHALLINYSDTPIPGSLQIIPQGILFEQGIKYVIFDLKEQEEAAILLKKPENELYFDLFAAIFYLLSRYEEYLMFAKDEHHRFKHEDSSLFHGRCLHIPIIDQWLLNFKKLLVAEFNFPSDSFRKDSFFIQATIDIDSVYAYKGRPFYRHLAAILKNLAFLQFGEISKRLQVIWFGKHDPNDNFDLQLQLLKEHDLQAVYFFQVGPYGKYDKNISPRKQGFIDIVKKIREAGHVIGLHPSYQSNSDTGSIMQEKKILESIIGTPITHSRQHFLRFSLPGTYENLITCGIQNEYSMGYSDINGFRAGTAFPFYWFDLKENKATMLRIVPFSTMDVAYKQFGKLNPDETIAQSGKLIRTLQQVNAPFCFVFHNESLSEHRGWQGWRKVFNYWLHG